MAEPVSNNNSYVTFKGVTFRRDQLSDRQFIDGRPIANNSGIVIPMKGKAYESYSVTLKDGTRVQFAEQSPENNARVIMGKNGVVSFDNIDNAIVFDTPKDDNYCFTNCSDVTVFAKQEEAKTYGYAHGGGIYYKETTVTKSTDNDVINALFCKNMDVKYSTNGDKFNKKASEIF